MKEELLWFVWQYKAFNQKALKTTDGQTVEILKLGQRNADAGPDFLNAQIKIGDTLWAGNVEMHLSASLWNLHGHQNDAAYDNVILHVVLQADEVIQTTQGRTIACLEISEFWNQKLVNEALALSENLLAISCAAHLHQVDQFAVKIWLERMAIDRLEEKSTAIFQKLTKNNFDWAQTFYELLARNLGMQINSEPMEWLAHATPNQLLAKVKPSLFIIEAILLGQSGLLKIAPEDEYVSALQHEYSYQAKKWGLNSLQAHVWKHLRLRPANFPAIRIAQLAALINRSEHLFSLLIETPIPDLANLFNVEASKYWQNHYQLGKENDQVMVKRLGNSAIDSILINAAAPMLFTYGKHLGNEVMKQKAIDLLLHIKAEKNRFTRLYENLGLKPEQALESQAMIQLYKHYCEPKHCIKCGIGTNLLLNQFKA